MNVIKIKKKEFLFLFVLNVNILFVKNVFVIIMMELIIFLL